MRTAAHARASGAQMIRMGAGSSLALQRTSRGSEFVILGPVPSCFLRSPPSCLLWKCNNPYLDADKDGEGGLLPPPPSPPLPAPLSPHHLSHPTAEGGARREGDGAAGTLTKKTGADSWNPLGP
eukprot:gene9792-biopygen16748